MSKVQPPERPNFIANLSTFQKAMASVAGSMFAVACITFIPFISRFFEPDFKVFLSYLRAGTAGTSLLCTSIVGVPNILNMLSWLLKFYEFYNKFKQNNPDK
jgi:hypothetical protein